MELRRYAINGAKAASAISLPIFLVFIFFGEQLIAAMFPDRSLLGLPLVADGQRLGAALIAYNDPHCFTEAEIARGEQVAGQIALALARAHALQTEREQRERVEALNSIIAQVAVASDLQTLLETALDRLLGVLRLEAGVIWLPPYGGRQLLGHGAERVALFDPLELADFPA